MRFRLWNLDRRARQGGYLACLGVFAFGAYIAAQNPTLKTRTREQRDREYLASHRIILNVQVADSTGKLVPDLAAADFTLFDNSQPRKIAGVHMIDGQAMYDATEIVILLDAVNSTAQELQAERDAIFKYLAQGHGPLPYPTSFVLWFNGHLKGAAPTTDRNSLGRAFVGMTKRVHPNLCAPANGSVVQNAASSSGPVTPEQAGSGNQDPEVANCLKAHFRDSVAALEGIAQQQKKIGGRTILIWVGQGWPLLSDDESLNPRARESYFEDLVGVVRDLRDAQVTIDAVAPSNDTREKEPAGVDVKSLVAGTISARNAGPRSLALPVLAMQTGGRVLTSSRDVKADLASCTHDADGYYAISFQAMPALTAHEFHRVEVKVNRPGLDVRTLTTYYAEP